MLADRCVTALRDVYRLPAPGALSYRELMARVGATAARLLDHGWRTKRPTATAATITTAAAAMITAGIGRDFG